MKSSTLEKCLLMLLKKIKEKIVKSNEFSGLGIIIYNPKYLSEIPHFSLRPSFRMKSKLNIRDENTFKFLLKTSKKSNKLHDGFCFFDKNGNLTHVSQYFVPPIRKIKPNENYGVRYHAAYLSSFLKGVILSAVVLEEGEAFIFKRGKIKKI